MRTENLRWAALTGLLTTLVVCGALWCAASASAADKLFWTQYTGAGALRTGTLTGLGAQTLVGPQSFPGGVVVDAAAGRVYWAVKTDNVIRVSNLDGTGAADLFTGETAASGLALDPASGTLFWDTSGSPATIRAGNVDGTGARTLFTGESLPIGLTVDPVAGRLYWGSYDGFAIRTGSVAGGTATNLFTNELYPVGVAVDHATGRLYWTNEVAAGKIRVGNVDGTGAHDLFTGEGYPGGVAIDPDANRIYWGAAGPGTVRVGNLDGTGTPQTLFGTEPTAWYVALLRTPAPAGIPTISGGAASGRPASCSAGSWAPDVLGGFLYRAPQSYAYQWLKDGAAIDGATTSTYTPFVPGAYRCQVTAANGAGSAAQLSAPLTIAAASGGGGTGTTGGGGGTSGTTTTSAGRRRVAAVAQLSWDLLANGGTRITGLVLERLSGPETIRLACLGTSKGCKTSATRTIKKHGRTLALTKYVQGMTLRPKARVTIVVSRPGFVSRIFRYTMISKRKPQKVTQCQAPGQKKLVVC